MRFSSPRRSSCARKSRRSAYFIGVRALGAPLTEVAHRTKRATTGAAATPVDRRRGKRHPCTAQERRARLPCDESRLSFLVPHDGLCKDLMRSSKKFIASLACTLSLLGSFNAAAYVQLTVFGDSLS